MSAKLINLSNPEHHLELDAEKQEWILGRDPDLCDLTIEDPKVSRQHVKLTASPHYSVENLSDTNPIYLNEHPITQASQLNNGDQLQIGDHVFNFIEHAHESNLDVYEEETQDEEDDDNPYETIFEEFSEFDADTDVSFTETQRFLLKVLTGPNTGAEFPLQEGKSYVIGTDTHACDLIFHDLSVSKKHAKLSLSEEGQLHIEDLESKNGILLEGQAIEQAADFAANTLVSLGTSTFTIIDHENAAETLISPSSSSILEIEEQEVHPGTLSPHTAVDTKPIHKEEPTPNQPKDRKSFALATLLIVAALMFTFVNISVSLFKSEEIITEQIDYQDLIQKSLEKFSKVEFSYRKNSGELFLQGHVLNSVEKSQLLYQLQSLNFISTIHDYVIIDDAIAKEHNEIFSKRPEWKGITIQVPRPGKFVITGYLQSGQQSETLSDYINRRFEFVDLLDNQVAVEEYISLSVENLLLEHFPDFKDVQTELINGELKLSGMIKAKSRKTFNKILEQAEKLRGIRTVNDYVVDVQESETLINVSHKYKVNGYSKHDDVSINVIVNGRIITRGDLLDGMTVTSIQPNIIYLEKDGLKYKIDYKK